MNDDIFPEQDDDSTIVTRGDLRRIVAQLESKLWRLGFLTVVGNQFLSHVNLPSIVGFTGGGLAIAGLVVKVIASRS